MSNNLRLYCKILDQMSEFHPKERLTRRRNLALLMTGLFLSRSVHLAHIVRKWPLMATLPGLEVRLRRFLDNPRLDVSGLYRPLAQRLLLRFEGTSTPIRLILDTTQLGPHHRMFSVSLAYRKRALPLLWQVYPKAKGHLSVREQKAFLRRLVDLMPPAEQPVILLGDSEFGEIGTMRYIRSQGWHFVLRLKGHYSVERGDSTWIQLGEMGLREGQSWYLGPVTLTQKHTYPATILMHWAPGEATPWYLASDLLGERMLLRHYSTRMWTEELYGDLKGHGFDLGVTRLNSPSRLEALVLGVCLVYVWLLILGAKTVKRGQRYLVDRKSRRDHSHFRIGWDFLEHCLRLALPIPLNRFSYLCPK